MFFLIFFWIQKTTSFDSNPKSNKRRYIANPSHANKQIVGPARMSRRLKGENPIDVTLPNSDDEHNDVSNNGEMMDTIEVENESYKRGFYSKSLWMGRKQGTNFLVKIEVLLILLSYY